MAEIVDRYAEIALEKMLGDPASESSGGPPSDSAPAAGSEAPTLIAGKFKSVSDLTEAYQNLERAFHEKSQQEAIKDRLLAQHVELLTQRNQPPPAPEPAPVDLSELVPEEYRPILGPALHKAATEIEARAIRKAEEVAARRAEEKSIEVRRADQELESLRSSFYQQNPDLNRHRWLVDYVTNEVAQEYRQGRIPDSIGSDGVLRLVADRARTRMRSLTESPNGLAGPSASASTSAPRPQAVESGATRDEGGATSAAPSRPKTRKEQVEEAIREAESRREKATHAPRW